MRGAFSFEDREAYDACGSMFLGKGKFPVDVLEFTPGRKSFQTYKMYGGLSVDIAPGWRVGGALDFSSRNAAKRKDLRYTGYALDMEVTPSLMYHSGDFAAGVSAIYARSTETVSAEQVGSAQSAPFAFFNEGLYFGNLQVWTGSGTRLREPGVSGLPVVQDALGAAAQLQPCRPVYAEADFRYLRGRVGERQTIWYRYEGPSASLRLELRTGAHTLRARGAWERLSNRESVLDKVVEGGITITREYGSNNIYRRNSLSSSLEYEYLGDMLELRSRRFPRRSILSSIPASRGDGPLLPTPSCVSGPSRPEPDSPICRAAPPGIPGSQTALPPEYQGLTVIRNGTMWPRNMQRRRVFPHLLMCVGISSRPCMRRSSATMSTPLI